MDKKKRISVLFACFNRLEKTKRCIESLTSIENYNWNFIVADGGSKDGTLEYLKEKACVDITIGQNELFYSNGMRAAMLLYKSKREEYQADFIMLVNDDVMFNATGIEHLLNDAERLHTAIVGCTEDGSGNLTYGGIVQLSKVRPKVKHVMSHDTLLQCDTCNGNCIILPEDVFLDIPIMDEHYVHSLGDYDYGFAIRRAGYDLLACNYFVGVCVDDHSQKNTWMDTSLSWRKRIQLKEKTLGHPTRLWFYYLNKNYSLFTAVICVIKDYIKILFGK